MRLSQKTYIISGVPKLARHKKAVERVVSIELIIATSDLNQRFRSSTIKNAAAAPKMIDGILIAKILRPSSFKQIFCTPKYGKLIALPSLMYCKLIASAVTAAFISLSLKPPGTKIGRMQSKNIKTIPIRM